MAGSNRTYFQKDWSVMQMVLNDTIMQSVQHVAAAMSKHFVGDMFDDKLWLSFLILAAQYVQDEEGPFPLKLCSIFS